MQVGFIGGGAKKSERGGLVLRAGFLLALCRLVCAGGLWGRPPVERRRRHVLPRPPVALVGAGDAPLRVLAFSAADCRQCHTMQMPALSRVKEARGAGIAIVEVDAPSSPALTQRFRVLTLPTTVVLDGAGHVRAINYGFANTAKLLE